MAMVKQHWTTRVGQATGHPADEASATIFTILRNGHPTLPDLPLNMAEETLMPWVPRMSETEAKRN
jgi:hypothetical protein